MGSLYTVVRNLTKHGLIEPTKTVREGGRPERTVYRITDAGREEFDDWVRELISTPEREHPRFKAGLSMLGALAPSDAAAVARSHACTSWRTSTTWPSVRRRRPGSVRWSMG